MFFMSGQVGEDERRRISSMSAIGLLQGLGVGSCWREWKGQKYMFACVLFLIISIREYFHFCQHGLVSLLWAFGFDSLALLMASASKSCRGKLVLINHVFSRVELWCFGFSSAKHFSFQWHSLVFGGVLILYSSSQSCISFFPGWVVLIQWGTISLIVTNRLSENSRFSFSHIYIYCIFILYLHTCR